MKTLALIFLSLSIKAQTIDSLIVEYEKTLTEKTVRVPKACECSPCASYCFEIKIEKQKPTYEDFTAWLRKQSINLTKNK